MSELVIEKDIIIDDIENVVRKIYQLSGRRIEDSNVIKTFINNELYTKFYADEKMSVKTEKDYQCLYMLLDTGYTDCYEKPIFISLLRSFGQYYGHFTGTLDEIAESNRSRFYKFRSDIARNRNSFSTKYANKIKNRKHVHIEDEREYLIGRCNEESMLSDLGRQIQLLNLSFEEPEEMNEQSVIEEQKAEPDFNEFEEKITIGILLEKIEIMQEYVEELKKTIEDNNQQNEETIKNLEKKNVEYERALKDIRCFVESEELKSANKESENDFDGHKLLGRGNKILVFGSSEIDNSVMQAIARNDYGFEKKDFEFETDYSKLVNSAGRINLDGKYKAVILGCCPHKVAGLGDWSSLVEKLKKSDSNMIAIDARSKAGELKVTKESFRTALCLLVKNLSDKWAA